MASNFFVGDIPNLPSESSYDFRFNYLNNCSDLCCLTESECSSECVSSTNERRSEGNVPVGVEMCVWTELNVTLLGVKKRIIQIETEFTNCPYISKSFACPNTSSLNSCNNTQMIIDPNTSDGSIVLEMNETFTNSQNPNTFQKYIYKINGEMCSTNVKVRTIVREF